jgi:anhydro-N-acetylmuramic acid kinase
MTTKYWYVIGLMSGTSLDGVDIVYTRISKENKGYDFKIIAAATIPYSKLWKQQLKNAFSALKVELDNLTIGYGNYLGEIVNEFVKKYQINKVDFVASHGHTIFHKPSEGYTLQIGDGKTLSNKTGFKVICDFRTQDVNFGGQGAPLVPIGDELLFSKYEYCLNLGGFANISFKKNNKRIAFDICPVNIVLNFYANKLGVEFDESGKIASSGKINLALLNELNEISFYEASIPKSLGFEFVKEIIFPLIEAKQLKVEDVLRTFVAHIVHQISVCLTNNSTSKILVTGGGAFNTFLMNELKKQTLHKIIIPKKEIIDYKEALIFALLAVLRSENQVNCLSSVTGAKKDHSSGKIFYPEE